MTISGQVPRDRVVYAKPTLIDEAAEILGWLWAALCDLLRRHSTGHHAETPEHTHFQVREAFGADDTYADVELPALLAADDTAEIPVYDGDSIGGLFTFRPPTPTDIAFRAAARDRARDASDLLGGAL